MRRVSRMLATLVVVPVAVSVGCHGSDVSAPSPNPLAIALSANGPDGIVLAATGGGQYRLQDAFDVELTFNALQHADGSVKGHFHESFVAEGETIDFRGDVICMAVDAANHRAWIGAVITENRSTHPQFNESFHQPGEDVWFRVVDYGEGAGSPPDRTTFLGFENTPGIPTSEIYCQLQIWPDDDARTWPVIAGNIQVMPND